MLQQRSKYRIKKELKSEITCVLEFIGMYDLVPSRVTYYDPVDNQRQQLKWIKRSSVVSFRIHVLEMMLHRMQKP